MESKREQQQRLEEEEEAERRLYVAPIKLHVFTICGRHT